MLDILRHGIRLSFGEALNHLRCEAGVSLIAAAQSVGLSPAAYQRVEAGGADLTYEQAVVLMHLFGATPAELSQLTKGRLVQRLNGSAPPFWAHRCRRRPDKSSEPETGTRPRRVTASSRGVRHA